MSRDLRAHGPLCSCPEHFTQNPLSHGDLPAPEIDQLLEPDPERYLAGGPLHDPCTGECEGRCECDD